MLSCDRVGLQDTHMHGEFRFILSTEGLVDIWWSGQATGGDLCELYFWRVVLLDG